MNEKTTENKETQTQPQENINLGIMPSFFSRRYAPDNIDFEKPIIEAPLSKPSYAFTNIEQKINNNFADPDINKMNDRVEIGILSNPIVYLHKSCNFDGNTFLYTIQRSRTLAELIELKKKMRFGSLLSHTINEYSLRLVVYLFIGRLTDLKLIL